MMFEVCRSLALDKTNLFLLAFWLKLILEKAITKITKFMKETKIKMSLLSLTLEPRNKSLLRSIIF